MTPEQPPSPLPTGFRMGARHPEQIGPYRILNVLKPDFELAGMMHEAKVR